MISKSFYTNAGKSVKNTSFQINVEKDIVNVETRFFSLTPRSGSQTILLLVNRKRNNLLLVLRYPRLLSVLQFRIDTHDTSL